MSCNYAEGLSYYENKGKLGLAEKFEDDATVKEKAATLAEWISASKHVVIHTGAGISTSAGIPDFRGPKGVWTLEAKGLKPNINTSFDDAIPTKTHMAVVALVKAGLVHFVVSQNIDGLHLKSGLPRSSMAELHGNMYVDHCQQCGRYFVRTTATKSVGQKCSDLPCPANRLNGRPCRGKLFDTILDWEDNLPEKELALADFHSCIADLSICLGTTLQIVPSGTLPLHTKKHGKPGKLVIVNLQPTKHDRQADLLINTYVDKVLELVCANLGVDIPPYSSEKDPTKRQDTYGKWTIPQSQVTKMRKIYEETCCKGKRKKRGYQNNDEDFKKKRKASGNGFDSTDIQYKPEKCEETSDEKITPKVETDVKSEVSEITPQGSVCDSALCSNNVLPKTEKDES